jgi:hypothetical protein
VDEKAADGRIGTTPPVVRADAAELRRMAERIVDVGALSEFVLALRDAVRLQAGKVERP